SAIKPILRPEVEHLFKAEELSRAARRLIIEGGPAPDEAKASAASFIDQAISELVAARAAFLGDVPVIVVKTL
ncbi:hypothetical protein, partial [Aurantimonas sp. C2-3-R2]|nr:hypothetical protein [Aurantimonas sp. C2-3-R2]